MTQPTQPQVSPPPPEPREFVRIAAAPSRLWPRFDTIEDAVIAWYEALMKTLGLRQTLPSDVPAVITEIRGRMTEMAATIDDEAIRESALTAFESAIGGKNIDLDRAIGLVRGLVISALRAANHGGATSMNAATAEVWLKHPKFNATLACETCRTVLPARLVGRERQRLVEVCPACGAG